MPSLQHTILVDVPWEQCFRVCLEVDLWPKIMPAVRSARRIDTGELHEVVEITAEVGKDIRTWRSEREIREDVRMISFRQLEPAYPLREMGGLWSFDPEGPSRTRVVLEHNYTTVDESFEGTIAAAIRSNAQRDLNGIKEYLENHADS